MKVYILLKTYEYDGSEILGVFYTQEQADTAKTQFIKDDTSNGDDEYDIEEFEIVTPEKTPKQVFAESAHVFKHGDDYYICDKSGMRYLYYDGEVRVSAKGGGRCIWPSKGIAEYFLTSWINE